MTRTRQRGYSEDWVDGIEGIRCVAAPTLDDYQRPFGAFAVMSPTKRLPQKRFVLQGGEQPVRDLFSGKRHRDETNAATLQFIQAVNQQHVDRTGPDATLLARLKSYELAAKMQTSIPQVSSFSDESAATQEAYGIHDRPTADMGRRCLLGRRLLEQGVRFVQLFSGGPIAERYLTKFLPDCVLNDNSRRWRLDRFGSTLNRAMLINAKGENAMSLDTPCL